MGRHHATTTRPPANPRRRRSRHAARAARAAAICLLGALLLLFGYAIAPTGSPAGPAPARADLALPAGAPGELGQWCHDHDTPQLRAQLTAAGLALLDGCIDLWWTDHPTPTPTPTAGPTPTGSPTPTPTPSPSTSPTPTPTPSPDCPGQANPACTGVPPGWQPTTTRGTWTITTPGTYTGVRVNGSIQIRAANVTLRQVEVVGGVINNVNGTTCYNGLNLDQVTITQPAGGYSNSGAAGVIGPGGYTANRVKIWNRVEGFRVGGAEDAGCGPTVITNSFVQITPPRPCGDWHGDGIQGYDAPPLALHNVTINFIETSGCGGTAPFYYAAGAGNAPPAVSQLLVRGGGFPFRLEMAGSADGVYIVDESWGYGPVSVACQLIHPFTVAVVRVDADWQVTTVVRPILC